MVFLTTDLQLFYLFTTFYARLLRTKFHYTLVDAFRQDGVNLRPIKRNSALQISFFCFRQVENYVKLFTAFSAT